MTFRIAGPVLAAIALAIGAPAPAAAQTSNLHLGPHVAYNFDAEEFGIGAQFSVPVARRLEFYPSFDYYFVDSGSLWALNADIKYRVATGAAMDWLYVGGGLNVAGRSVGDVNHTDAGVNAIVGAESLRGNLHPFGEARLILGDGSTFQLAVGLNLTLGRH